MASANSGAAPTTANRGRAGTTFDPAALLAGNWFAAAAVGLGAAAVVVTDMPGIDESWPLWGEITDHEPGLWVARAVALVLVVAATRAVVRHCAPERVVTSLALLVLSLPMVVPWLSRLAGVSFTGELRFSGEGLDEDLVASGRYGAGGITTALAFVALASVAAAVACKRAGVTSPAHVKHAVGTVIAAVGGAAGSATDTVRADSSYMATPTQPTYPEPSYNQPPHNAESTPRGHGGSPDRYGRPGQYGHLEGDPYGPTPPWRP